MITGSAALLLQKFAGAAPAEIKSPADGTFFSRVSFGTEQNGIYGWGVFWGNIRYTPAATQ